MEKSQTQALPTNQKKEVIHLEFKSSKPGSIKDIDVKKGIVTGYCSVFNVLDDHDDIILPGAYKRTINAWGPHGKNRIKALKMHDPALPVGRPILLKEDKFGLYHETQFSMGNSVAKDMFQLILDGVIQEQSIGYDVIHHEMDGDVRKLKELRLWEYSFLLWGANSNTFITGVKGLSEPYPLDSPEKYKSLKDSMKRMEKALRNGTFLSEEVPEALEYALKRWQAEIKNLEDLEKQQSPPVMTDNLVIINNPSKALIDPKDPEDSTPEGNDPPPSTTPDNSADLISHLSDLKSLFSPLDDLKSELMKRRA